MPTFRDAIFILGVALADTVAANAVPFVDTRATFRATEWTGWSNKAASLDPTPPFRYVPLYMLTLVARGLTRGSLDGVVATPPTW